MVLCADRVATYLDPENQDTNDLNGCYHSSLLLLVALSLIHPPKVLELMRNLARTSDPLLALSNHLY